MLRAELGDGEPTPAVELDEVELPEARKLPAPLPRSSARRRWTPVTRRACATRSERAIPDLIRSRGGRARARSGRGGHARVTPSRWPPLLERLLGGAGRGRSVRRRDERRRRGRATRAARTRPRDRASTCARLRAVAVDPVSMTATLGPGLRGPEAERALGERGFTAGHFPQSFEYATIGGFAATRSAGQASAGYGRFDELVTALAIADPDRRAAHAARPRTPPPVPRCASWCSAPRGCSGRSPR